MCGRFTRQYTWREIYELYRLTVRGPESNFPPRYNICPTTDIDVVVPHEDGRELTTMRWGLVPSWWKKPLRKMPATFNARTDTITEKPMFRDAFKKRRCLIPASGYYEWVSTPSGKQPFYFTRKDGQLLTIAGVWSEWTNPEDGQQVKSTAMAIGPANDFVSRFHNRMPLILEPDEFPAWERGDPKLAEILLHVHKENVLQAWPVSRRVNSSRADDFDASLIEQIHLVTP